MNLSSHLQTVRISQRKTQREIAKAANVDRSTISLIEKGKPFSFDMLRTVCLVALKMDAKAWHVAKLLWLQDVSGEPIQLDQPAKTILKAEAKGLAAIVQQVRHAYPQIQREKLEPHLTRLLEDPALLRSLPQVIRLYQAYRPEATPPTQTARVYKK